MFKSRHIHSLLPRTDTQIRPLFLNGGDRFLGKFCRGKVSAEASFWRMALVLILSLPLFVRFKDRCEKVHIE
jgi:hypothetical protein